LLHIEHRSIKPGEVEFGVIHETDFTPLDVDKLLVKKQLKKPETLLIHEYEQRACDAGKGGQGDDEFGSRTPGSPRKVGGKSAGRKVAGKTVSAPAGSKVKRQGTSSTSSLTSPRSQKSLRRQKTEELRREKKKKQEAAERKR
jgi:hypothetical protein